MDEDNVSIDALKRQFCSNDFPVDDVVLLVVKAYERQADPEKRETLLHNLHFKALHQNQVAWDALVELSNRAAREPGAPHLLKVFPSWVMSYGSRMRPQGKSGPPFKDFRQNAKIAWAVHALVKHGHVKSDSKAREAVSSWTDEAAWLDEALYPDGVRSRIKTFQKHLPIDPSMVWP